MTWVPPGTCGLKGLGPAIPQGTGLKGLNLASSHGNLGTEKTESRQSPGQLVAKRTESRQSTGYLGAKRTESLLL